MSGLLLEPASDWTGQTHEERLLLCAETLFIHGLIGSPAHQHITRQARARARADIQRAHRATCTRNLDHG